VCPCWTTCGSVRKRKSYFILTRDLGHAPIHETLPFIRTEYFCLMLCSLQHWINFPQSCTSLTVHLSTTVSLKTRSVDKIGFFVLFSFLSDAVLSRWSDKHILCDCFNIQNDKNYAMFSICENCINIFIQNRFLADDHRRGNSVCII